MVWPNFITNKYTLGGFFLMVAGFFTLPVMIGFLLMPVGISLFIFGIGKMLYDSGDAFWEGYQKIRSLFK